MSVFTELNKLRGEVDALVERHRVASKAIDYAKYRGRIVAFAREVLGVTQLTDTQCAHLGIAVASARSAAYGANGCGKTFDDAIVALYLIYVENYLVIATSAKESQLRDQYMRDIRRLFHQATDLDGDLYTMQLRRAANEDSGLLCMAASSSDNLRSFHAPRVAVQLQEAQGLPDFAFESAEMMAVGDVDKVTLTGNSTQVGGAFHRRCLSSQWASIRFDAEQHPNVIEGRTVIPGGPTRESIAQRRADYGADSAFYVASVNGLFPSESVEGLTTRALLEASFALHESASEGSVTAMWQPVIVSWDPSLRGEDMNAVCVAQGRYVRELHTWHSDDMNRSYQRVEALASAAFDFWATPETRRRRRERANRGEYQPRPTLVIDESGMGGPAVDAMQLRGYAVTGFIGASTPTVTTARFLNLRAEAMWVLRQGLEQGTVAIPRNAEFAEEILATQWTVNGSDKIQIQAKDDVRAIIGRSTDLLDAVSMALWYSLTQTMRGVWGSSTWKGGYLAPGEKSVPGTMRGLYG